MHLSLKSLDISADLPLQGTKLEVESILRETCDRVLADATLSREKAELRAVALQILGEAYMSVKKDADAASGDGKGEDSEYVRIDTKNSRARQARGGHSPGPSYEGRGGKLG
jgi:hypothetical protein